MFESGGLISAMADSTPPEEQKLPESATPSELQDEEERLKKELAGLQLRTQQLQKQIQRREGSSSTLANEAKPALLAHLDRLVEDEILRAGAIVTAKEQARAEHLGHAQRAGTQNRDVPGIESVRVACYHHDDVGNTEETSVFVRLSDNISTFQELKLEVLRFWQVPGNLHLRVKLVDRQGAIWPLGASVMETFANMKVSPEVWLVVTEPYSFDDVSSLGLQSSRDESEPDDDREGWVLEQLSHGIDDDEVDESAEEVPVSIRLLREQASRLHIMVWMFLLVVITGLLHMFLGGSFLRRYPLNEVIADFVKFDQLFDETVDPTSSDPHLSSTSHVTLDALHELTLNEVAEYFEVRLRDSVFGDHSLGLTVVVGDILLQTTRVAVTTCADIGTLAASASEQIQNSMCYPTSYDANTLSSTSFGRNSRFSFVDSGSTFGWSTNSAGFFQPLPILWSEYGDWDQIFADLRNDGFWDIQTHEVNAFFTLFSRNLNVVLPVSVSFTRQPSGNFRASSSYEYFPLREWLRSNTTSTSLTYQWAPFAAVPAMVVSSLACASLLWIQCSSSDRRSRRGWKALAGFAVQPTTIFPAIALLFFSASMAFLIAFVATEDTLSFAVPRQDQANPSLVGMDVSFAANLTYTGAYSPQWLPGLLYTLHSSTFTLGFFAVCLPFTELALLIPMARQHVMVIKLAARNLVVPIVTDMLIFCTFAASGRLITGTVISHSGTVVDWLHLVADCFIHGQSLHTVFHSPTSTALVTQMAFMTACIVYICAITVPMYYAVVFDALQQIQADTQAAKRNHVLNFSLRRLLQPYRPWDKAPPSTAQADEEVKLHTPDDAAVWTDNKGWLPNGADGLVFDHVFDDDTTRAAARPVVGNKS